MGSRIVKVFYDQSCYPFKDSERTVRYPITGSSFAGSSNVNELHFYVRDIGGVNNLSWVAIVKLPNGKILYQLLTDIHLDSEINEYYVTFNLSQFYTQLKGDIYISLNGCLGEVTITTDEETDISTIQGEIDSKTVVATGAVKFSINYAPQRPIGLSFDLDQYQTIINALANKANIVSTIQVVADITTEDLSAYDNGQKFFSLADNTYYEKIATSPFYQLVENNSGVLASERLLVKSNIPIIGVLKDIAGEKGLVIYSYNHKDYLISFDASDLTNIKGCAFDLLDRCFYYAENLVVGNNIGLLINDNNKIEHLDLKRDINCVYATDGGGNQIMLPYAIGDIANTLAKRTSGGQVNVAETPANDTNATSKKYVDTNDNKKVDKVSTNNRVYGTNGNGEQTTYPIETANNGNIARRDSSGQLNVPPTPTQNPNATSKGYVDGKFGVSIELSIDSNYDMVLKLKNANGEVISQDDIDLPLESIITSAQFYETYTYEDVTYTNVLVITLATTSVPTIIPVGSLVDGLEHEAYIEVSNIALPLAIDSLQLANLPNARIKYGSNYYLKSYDNGVSIVFALPRITINESNGVYTLSKEEITLNKTSGYMTLNTTTIQFYSSAKTDELLSVKANSSDVYDKQTADAKFRTEGQVNTQIDTKIAGLDRINYIQDLEENKNYDYRYIVTANGELVLRLAEIE